MPRDDQGDYEVGYGKPPYHSQFRKGQSGNPRGRPSGSKNFATLAREVLSERVVVTDKGGRKKMTKQKAIVAQLVNQSLKGNMPATKVLIEMQDNQARGETEAPERLFSAADEKTIELLKLRLNSQKRVSDD